MKKVLFFLLILTFLPSYGQSVVSLSPIDIQIGLSHYSIDTKSSRNNSFSFGASLNRFYFDMSTNSVSGYGSYLDYSSSETYITDKVNAMVFNLGYVIMPSDKFSVVPMLGWGLSSNIYQDPIAFDTYFQGDQKSYVNIAVIGKFYINNFGIYAGVGTFERFKVGLSYRAC